MLTTSESKAAKPIDMYLIETVSWDTESGAPVYIKKAQTQFIVLGLVHGHYSMRAAVPEGQQKDREVDPNAGIMAVIPAQAIFDTVNQEELKDHRQKVINARLRN